MVRDGSSFVNDSAMMLDSLSNKFNIIADIYIMFKSNSAPDKKG